MNSPTNKPTVNVNYNNSSHVRGFYKSPLVKGNYNDNRSPAYSPMNFFRPPRLAQKVNTTQKKNKTINKKNKNKNPLMMSMENAFANAFEEVDNINSINTNNNNKNSNSNKNNNKNNNNNKQSVNEKPIINTNAPYVGYTPMYKKSPLVHYQKNHPKKATAQSPINFFGLQPKFWNKYYGYENTYLSNDEYNGTNSYFPLRHNNINNYGGKRKTRKSKRSSSLNGRR